MRPAPPYLLLAAHDELNIRQVTAKNRAVFEIPDRATRGSALKFCDAA
jgi:hypothetical protein